MLGENLLKNGMKLFALAAVASTGMFAGSASADRVVGTQQVYANPSGQSVLTDVTNYTARDNGDGTFFVNVANILRSSRTRLTGVFFESGFDSLVNGLPTVSFMKKGENGTVTPETSFSTNVPGTSPLAADSIDWNGSAASVTADTVGAGLSNEYRMLMTFSYADGVTFDDVSALLGGFGYRIATLVEDIGSDVTFGSTSGELSNPDGGTSGNGGPSAVPTPSAVAGGLALLGFAGFKRRRNAA